MATKEDQRGLMGLANELILSILELSLAERSNRSVASFGLTCSKAHSLTEKLLYRHLVANEDPWSWNTERTDLSAWRERLQSRPERASTVQTFEINFCQSPIDMLRLLSIEMPLLRSFRVGKIRRHEPPPHTDDEWHQAWAEVRPQPSLTHLQIGVDDRMWGVESPDRYWHRGFPKLDHMIECRKLFQHPNLQAIALAGLDLMALENQKYDHLFSKTVTSLRLDACAQTAKALNGLLSHYNNLRELSISDKLDFKKIEARRGYISTEYLQHGLSSFTGTLTSLKLDVWYLDTLANEGLDLRRFTALKSLHISTGLLLGLEWMDNGDKELSRRLTRALPPNLRGLAVSQVDDAGHEFELRPYSERRWAALRLYGATQLVQHIIEYKDILLPQLMVVTAAEISSREATCVELIYAFAAERGVRLFPTDGEFKLATDFDKFVPVPRTDCLIGYGLLE